MPPKAAASLAWVPALLSAEGGRPLTGLGRTRGRWIFLDGLVGKRLLRDHAGKHRSCAAHPYRSEVKPKV